MTGTIIDREFMDTAKDIAKKSTCVRYQVGALLTTHHGEIITDGFNSAPAVDIQCNEHFSKNIELNEDFKAAHFNYSNNTELHAEQIVIGYCAKHGIPTDGTKLYVTLEPCLWCSKLIYASGIKTVIYNEKYDRLELTGTKFLIDHDIEVIYLGE